MTNLHRNSVILWIGLAVLGHQWVGAEDKREPDAKRQETLEFHRKSQERTGVLVPMYLYPENIHTNPVYNRLIATKRRFETVPIWVIVNPASGPGTQTDANYTKAIDRLQGAGCVVLGYVATSYGKKSVQDVHAELETWTRLYPRTQGIFFDEMIYEDKEDAVAHQMALNRDAHRQGYWPTVANPGTDTPGRYFARNAADVIVIHETESWPTEKKLKGDYFGGYSDYPPWTRAVLVYSQPKLDLTALAMSRRYCRWIYITDDQFRPNDPKADNPWDTLSVHVETICEQLAKP